MFHHWMWPIALGPVCLLTLGFFGEQAVRLLRESWDGIVHPRPDGSMAPHGATELAQELFAMLDDSIPQTQNAPVTLNQTQGVPLTINNPEGGNAIALNGGDFTAKGGDLTLDGGKLNAGSGGIAVTDGDINVNGGFYLWNGVPLGLGRAGGTSTFLGKVRSGSGDTYVVDLYGAGTDADPTVAGVTVKVPQIDSSDAIPADTWLAAVHVFTVGDATFYEAQPPVWLA